MTEAASPALPHPDAWLLPFVDALREGGVRVVELGCGPGLDAAWLAAQGFDVVGCDRSPRALAQARVTAPRAQLLRADIGRPLPFEDHVTGSVVSSLALHYFDWRRTRSAFADVRRILWAEGRFVFRVNASDDTHHGAGQGEEIGPGFFRDARQEWSHADTKRFFDEEMVREAVDGLFSVEHLAHRTISRYANPKQVWECVARKIDQPSK